MQIQIHAPWEVNEHIKEIITEKIERLQTYYKRIERADIYLKLDKRHTPDGKIVKIQLAVPKNDLFAEDHAESFEKAIAGAIHKLQPQIEKHKAKLSKR